MTVENLPAVREPAAVSVARRDTDSWAEMLPKVAELAQKICNTDFVPQSLRNNVAATAAAVLYGREVGLPPMTALGNVNVINGRPGLSAVIMRAQVLAAGHELREIECTSARCIMSGRRMGADYWQTIEYTFEDAKRAGLLAKNANYEKNPRRMLRARATSELCELMFADVVRGMSSLEELEEIEDDAPAGVAGALPPARGASKVQRKSRAKSGAGATSAPGDDGAAAAGSPRPADSTPPAPSSPPPPLPGEPGYDGAQSDAGPEVASVAAEPASRPQPPASVQPGLESADGQPADGAPGNQGTGAPPAGEQGSLPDPEEVPPGRPASKAILRAIRGQFRELGYGDSDADKTARLAAAEAIVGRPVDTFSDDTDLTHEEARKIASVAASVEDRSQLAELLGSLAEQQDREEEGK